MKLTWHLKKKKKNQPNQLAYENKGYPVYDVNH